MTLRELEPLELNKFRFPGETTPLTPEQIEKLRQSADTSKTSTEQNKSD